MFNKWKILISSPIFILTISRDYISREGRISANMAVWVCVQAWWVDVGVRQEDKPVSNYYGTTPTMKLFLYNVVPTSSTSGLLNCLGYWSLERLSLFHARPSGIADNWNFAPSSLLRPSRL